MEIAVKEGGVLVLAEVMPTFGGLREGEKLNQSLVKEHFVHIDQLDK